MDPEEIRKKLTLLPFFPKVESSKTLLLDLDETLIHVIDPKINYVSMNIPIATAKDIIFEDKLKNKCYPMKFFIRPFAIKMLRELSKIYEIAVMFHGKIYIRFLQQDRCIMRRN